MSLSNPHGSAFDFEEFIIHLSAQLCGHDATCQALSETVDNRSHYLFWRSPILTPAVQDDPYVSAPHPQACLVYVDVLFQFARTFVSVQFGGLILEADASGGRDVTSGCLTLEDLRLLFDTFGYDLFLQENSQTPAVNVAKALKALANQSNAASFLSCNSESVTVTLTLGQANAPLSLYHAERGESDRIGLRLLKRMIQKAIAASASVDNGKNDSETDLANTLLQWKSNKFHQALTTATTTLPTSPTKATTAPAATTTPTKPLEPSPVKKKKPTAVAGPKMAVIRKAKSRANKFGFAGSSK